MGLFYFFQTREKHPNIPYGLTKIFIEDEEYEADFVKVAVNVIRKKGSPENKISNIMTKWFGPDAGLPGTNFQVSFECIEKGYQLSPIKMQTSESELEIWSTYSRDKIPGCFGLEFNTGSWNQGFVDKGENIFLLVTLEKEDLSSEFNYKDHFLSSDLFQWQSRK